MSMVTRSMTIHRDGSGGGFFVIGLKKMVCDLHVVGWRIYYAEPIRENDQSSVRHA